MYPLVRGLGPVLVLAPAAGFLDASASVNQTLGVAPVAAGVVLAAAYAAGIAGLEGRAALRAELGLPTVQASLSMFGAHTQVLAAPRLAPAAPARAVRESSVIVATALAAIFLREEAGSRRLAGAATVVAGAVLVSAG